MNTDIKSVAFMIHTLPFPYLHSFHHLYYLQLLNLIYSFYFYTPFTPYHFSSILVT